MLNLVWAGRAAKWKQFNNIEGVGVVASKISSPFTSGCFLALRELLSELSRAVRVVSCVVSFGNNNLEMFTSHPHDKFQH